MEKHERRCFRNPNRFCDYCENKGYTTEQEDIYTFKQTCPYCAKRDAKVEAGIAEYEKNV